MYDIAHWHDWLPGFAPESLKRPPTDQSSNIWLHSIYVYLSHGSTDSFEPPQLQGTHPLTLIWGICPGTKKCDSRAWQDASNGAYRHPPACCRDVWCLPDARNVWRACKEGSINSGAIDFSIATGSPVLNVGPGSTL